MVVKSVHFQHHGQSQLNNSATNGFDMIEPVIMDQTSALIIQMISNCKAWAEIVVAACCLLISERVAQDQYP